MHIPISLSDIIVCPGSKEAVERGCSRHRVRSHVSEVDPVPQLQLRQGGGADPVQAVTGGPP